MIWFVVHWHGDEERERIVLKYVSVFVAGIALSWTAPVLHAAELVMFEAKDCVWCLAWQREIGPIYPKTEEGRRAPLRRVDIDEPRSADLENIKGILYTPTFVLVEKGEEVGRILGYPGELHFWGLLGIELQKLGTAPQI